MLWPVQTRWSDNDQYGHVNNAAYYFLIDSAVNGWLIEASGVDTTELSQIGVVATNACRFIAPVSFPETLHIGIATSRIGRSSITYQLAIFREDSDDLCAVAKFVHVYVSRETRQPDLIPDVVTRLVSKLPSISPLID